MNTQRSGAYSMRARTNAQRGFEDFFGQNYLKLGRALYLLVGNRGDAEDLAQEAFVRVYARWDRVEQMASPDGYLYQVALNLYRRSLRARHMAVGPLEDILAPSADETNRVDSRVDLLRILQCLPAKQREAFVLVEWLGLDSATASSLLGIAPASVRGRVFRARHMLRRQYSTESGGKENE